MTAWLTVLTNPARRDYLRATLDSLDCSGAAVLAELGKLTRVMAVDGAHDDVPARKGWARISVGNGSSGIRRALRSTIVSAFNEDADHLLYFEDDVAGCRNAVLALHDLPVPDDCGFLVACDMTHLGHYAGGPRKVEVIKHTDFRINNFWGTQAVKLPRAALAHVAEQQILGIPSAEQHVVRHNGDRWLREQLASPEGLRQSFGVLAPSIFQHVGTKSLAWPKRKPVTNARGFLPDRDALNPEFPR